MRRNNRFGRGYGAILVVYLCYSIHTTNGFVPRSTCLTFQDSGHFITYKAKDKRSFQQRWSSTNPSDDSKDPGGDDDDDNNNNNNDRIPKKKGKFDVQKARQQLESMLGSMAVDTDNSSPDTNQSFSFQQEQSPSELLQSIIQESMKDESIFDNGKLSKLHLTNIPTLLPPPPPLSTIERDRRQAEVALLQKLVDGDDASSTLWEFWYSERGTVASERLQLTDPLLGQPPLWDECETKLNALIDDYGWYFCEPLNRLATLYFLQGKLAESYVLCIIILNELKPWHFGALSGIVQVSLGLGNRDVARYWAQKRLPSTVAGTSFPPFDGTVENPRRVEWVNDMVSLANNRFKEAERLTQTNFFGKPEDYYYGRKNVKNYSSDKEASKRILGEEEVKEDADDDAWQ